MIRPPTPPLTGVILAGGQSRRMGRDKASLRTGGGVDFLDHARRTLRAAGVEAIRVLGRPEVHDGVADVAPGGGPGRALAHFFTESSGAVVAMPLDMPLLTAAMLRFLLADGGSAHFAGQPLPAVLRGARGDLAACVRVDEILAAGGARAIPIPKPWRARLLNVNAAADYTAYRHWEDRQ